MLNAGEEACGFLIIDSLGEGSTSHVYKALERVSGRLVALKVFLKSNMDMKKLTAMRNEVHIMRQLHHENIVAFYDFFQDDLRYYISMEYIQKGSLLKLISATSVMNENAARKIFTQLINTLDYLHNKMNIAHRDVKLENILLDQNWNVKLIDFGLSGVFSPQDPFFTNACGTPTYVAPELINNIKYTASVDVWAAGVVLYILTTGFLPFADQEYSRLASLILNSTPKYPENLSESLKNLISSMLSKEASNRISAREILDSEWVNIQPRRIFVADADLELVQIPRQKSFLLPKLDQNVAKTKQMSQNINAVAPVVKKVIVRSIIKPNTIRIKSSSSQPF